MHLTFRSKLMGIVGVAALALLMLVVASGVIAKRVELQLTTIQDRYVPRVELEAQLEAQLERITRSFQDAVAVHDAEGLAATKLLEATFLEQLARAGDAVDPTQAAAVRAALDDYYGAADDVSRRLIANETGEALLDAVATMQEKHAHLAQILKEATRFDRRELTGAFTAAARAEATASRYRLGISLGCVVLVLLMSVTLSRSLLRALTELNAGFQRFGAGDFGEPIPVTTHDELGDLAEGANAMARSLEKTQHLLRKVHDRLEATVEERTTQLVQANDQLRASQAAIQELNQTLELRVDERTAQLSVANQELEAFSYAVAHDLRAPLRGVTSFAEVLVSEYEAKLDADGKDCLLSILTSARRMAELIDALLSLSRVTRSELKTASVDLSALASSIVAELAVDQPRPHYELVVAPNARADMDPRLARDLLENLLGNAWKFTAKVAAPRIEFGVTDVDGARAFFVRDNGAGFDPAYASKLFTPFQRLHTVAEFSGTGIGLATVERIVHRHGGRIWAEGKVDGGATFYFALRARAEEG